VIVYHWAMRNGAGILFAVSLLIFAISLAGSFLMPGSLGSFPSEPGQSFERLGFLLAIVGSLGTAVSHSALTFFGACLLYRLDAVWVRGAMA
jgi:hypothetical protein